MLVINPEPCIDCFACQEACPVRAIYLDEDVPDVYRGFIAINATRWAEGENVTSRLPPIRETTLDEIKARENERGYGSVEDP